jgi:cytochrome P450
MSATTSLHDRLEALFTSEPDAMSDQTEIFAEARAAGPVIDLGWVSLITRHSGVKAAVRDLRLINQAYGQGSRAEAVRARLDTDELRHAFEEVSAFESNFLSRTDDAQHIRLRRLLQHAFTPRRIAELGEAVDRYTDQFLAPLHDGEEADLMPFAYRLPLMVVCDMLGVPAADRELIHDWSLAVARNRGGLEPGPLLDAYNAEVEFGAYVQAMIDDHRRSAGSGGPLVAALLDAEDEEGITLEEMTANFVVLLFAGHETTTSLIGGGVLALLESRDQWQFLVGDPAAIEPSIPELLRHVSPVQWIVRFAREGLEVDGEAIEQGKTVLPLVASANRDAAVFAHPDTLDLRRPDVREMLAFGLGAHYCLGASLATLEGTIALRALTEQFPKLELAGAEVTWDGNAQFRRPAALRVRLG